ncbi:MAG TPA: AMP-binding protein [Hyphomicrobiaceae bacterium]|nr:AMP-binding protein [Hyphomicrobiaceae bacterium]
MRLPPEAPATVFETFVRAAARHGERACLAVLPETAAAYDIAAGELAYGEALARVRRLSDSYRDAGYGHGHRVGLLLENRPAYFLHWYALNALGVSVVPINPDLRSAELEYQIGHSGIVAAVASRARQTGIERAATAIGVQLPVVGPDDPPAPPPVPAPKPGVPDRNTECALLYTSGTTGKPKGCVLANEYFLYAGHWYAQVGGLIALQHGSERMLTPLPVFHMNAMACSTMAMLTVGGCLIVLDRFHPRSWWHSVREARATVVHYLGVMPPMLMSAPESADDRAHHVRFGFGAGVDRDLHARFETRFGFPLIEAWAMTETGAGAQVVAAAEPRHIGTNCFGKPGPEVDVRIVDDAGREAGIDEPGELLVRHAGDDPRYGFFREYLKDADATAAAWQGGWFHTGDIVRRGDDGALHFVDRKKNVIRRSGENISAVEVEGVLMQHAAVRHAAVAAVPDPLRGDEVFACIVARELPVDRAARERLAADIVAWCLQRLAYYKAPGYIAFVPDVPLTATQKILRGQLKDLVAKSLGAEACVDTRHLKKRVRA